MRLNYIEFRQFVKRNGTHYISIAIIEITSRMQFSDRTKEQCYQKLDLLFVIINIKFNFALCGTRGLVWYKDAVLPI